MRKIIFILLLSLLPLSAQAKSTKLGDTDLNIKSVKTTGGEKVCTSHDQCKTGLCKDGSCVYCDADNPCSAGKTCLLGVCKDAGSCNSTSDCEGGYKCVDGSCQVCASGETGCNCGDAAANGNGGCGCEEGKFQYGGECVSYCDFTVCGPGLEKVKRDDRCCCEYGPE